MSIAIAEEHRELARVARSFLESHDVLAETRAWLDEPSPARTPTFWKEMAELGWAGLHVGEAYGGQGFGLPELVIVVEELGRAVAPGPFLPTVLASAVLAETGGDDLRRRLLPGLADGSALGAVGLGGALALEGGRLEGSAGLVLGAGEADVRLLAVGEDLVVLEGAPAGLTVEAVANLDPGRPVSRVTCNGVEVPADHVLAGGRTAAQRLSRVLGAAEAAGLARACTEMAAAYANEREQFGRPIGTFQAVKHHCANMLVATEQATAGAWASARGDLEGDEAALAAAIACCLALPAAEECAQLNIQVHGGIGFTWEHDAHLYLRRAIALNAALGPVDAAREDVTRWTAAGVRARSSLELPPEAEEIRTEVRAFVDRYRELPKEERRKALADAGYLMPHWPKPWGRDASPIEQLVIEEEFAEVGRPNMGISGWNTLTIAQHGSPEQVERFVRPSLEGEIEFCQLFSEPGAGSDAAGVQTRGVKVEGGWRVAGQKVWTSGAHLCTHGFATVRTDPNAPKHQGISMMVIDMKAKGVEVRPLRQITGHSHFNEVFLDDVFVPDEDVVGPVNQGWTVARSTLGNERVSIGGSGLMITLPLVALMQQHRPGDVGIAREVGAVLAGMESMRMLNVRRVARAVAGAEPGAEGNVTKLLGSEIGHRMSGLAARLIGPGAAVPDGADGFVTMAWLGTRGMSIAGGTSEIVRNQIAERLLGLPRDPLIK